MTNYSKGREYEMHIAALLRKKVASGVRNKGSHANWHRRSDVYTELPIHIEAKHHESVRIKDWMEQAEGAASFSQTPVVVFRIEEKDYACLNFSQLLDLFVQVADMQLEIEDLRAPAEGSVLQNTPINKPDPIKEAEKQVTKAIEQKATREELGSCKNGHLLTAGGKCMWKGCVYSRTYVKPKAKGKGKK